MKFTCDNCHARYSIADEKLKGKVVRVRCKRCGNSILLSADGQKKDAQAMPGEDSTALVRVDDLLKHIDEEIIEEEDEGDEPKFVSRSSLLPTVAAPRPMSEATPPPPGPNSIPPKPPSPPEWFILVNREEIGPMSVNDLRERGRAGTLTRRTYVWRDGQAAWERLERVPQLKELSDSLPAAVANASTSTVPPVKARQKVEPPKSKSASRLAGRLEGQKEEAATRPEMPQSKPEPPPPTPAPVNKPQGTPPPANKQAPPTPVPSTKPPARESFKAAAAPEAFDEGSEKTIVASPKAEMQARLIEEAASWADDAARSLSSKTPKMSEPVPAAQPKPPEPSKVVVKVNSAKDTSGKPAPAAVVVDQAQLNPPKPAPEVTKTASQQERHMVVLDEQSGAADNEELELDDDRTLVQKSPFEKKDGAPAAAVSVRGRADTAPSTSRPLPAPPPPKGSKAPNIDDGHTRAYIHPPGANRNAWILAIIFGAAALGATAVLVLHYAAQGHGKPASPPHEETAVAATPTPVPNPTPVADKPKADAPAPTPVAEPPKQPPAPVPEAPNDRVDEKALAQRVEQIQPSIERCVTLALQHSPGIRLGKVTVTLTVAGSGKVTKMHYDKPAFADTELGKCIAVKVKTMVLPSFKHDSQDVDFPLDLSGD